MEKREKLSQNAKGNKIGKKKIDMDRVLSDLDMNRKSIKDVCAEYDISRETLRKHFLLFKADHPEDPDLQNRKSLCGGKKHPQYKYIDMEEVYQLLDSGQTISEVCNQLNISKTTLYKKFKQYEDYKETL